MLSCTRVKVSVDCNLFRSKSHVNPISRLVEPIANAIEHGKAQRVDVWLERTTWSSSGDAPSELFYSVTESDGTGMSPEEVEDAIRFGAHRAKATTGEKLANYSHNVSARTSFLRRIASSVPCLTSHVGWLRVAAGIPWRSYCRRASAPRPASTFSRNL
eukprot:COSAG01_NODE_11475_length_1926_cov_44.272578_4_plen_159_part_00